MIRAVGFALYRSSDGCRFESLRIHTQVSKTEKLTTIMSENPAVVRGFAWLVGRGDAVLGADLPIFCGPSPFPHRDDQEGFGEDRLRCSMVAGSSPVCGLVSDKARELDIGNIQLSREMIACLVSVDH